MLLHNKLAAYLEDFEVGQDALNENIKQRLQEKEPMFTRINKRLNAVEAKFLQEQIILRK